MGVDRAMKSVKSRIDKPARRRRTTQSRRKSATRPKPVNLALQGGGSHGAFTWGVLDRLLEDGRVEIEAISGTSAGAMNAVVLADGMTKGGLEGARQALADFWRAMARVGRFGPFMRTPFEFASRDWSLDYSPSYVIFEMLSRVVSPYQFNPLNFNPVQEVLEAQIDFDRVRRCDKVKVFISATSVRTGKIKQFQCEDLSANAVMASACLPSLFQAVEIDGEAYWDGGYMGNPAIYPLIYNCQSRDVVIVQVNPLTRDTVPTTPRDILDRVNEVSFNSTLMREMRAIAFLTQLIDEGELDASRFKRVLIHRIEAESAMHPFGASSKLNAEWGFLTHLRDIGREAAAEWLEGNFHRLGRESTVDIETDYL